MSDTLKSEENLNSENKKEAVLENEYVKISMDEKLLPKLLEECRKLSERINALENPINPKIQFTKIRDVKSPCKKNKYDACTDYFIPNGTPEYLKELQEQNKNSEITIYQDIEDEEAVKNNVWKINIAPHQKLLIPSGIKVNILDKRTYLGVKNKSGIATDYGILKTAEIIDSIYQGELFFGIYNLGEESVEVWTGMKIIQLMQQEYVNSEYEEISNEEYSKIEKSDRGEGARSSTGLS